MSKFTEDDVGTIVTRGGHKFEVDPWGKLQPVAQNAEYIRRRNRRLKEPCPW